MLVGAEHDVLAHQKVQQRTPGNAHQVGWHGRQVRLADQHPHQHQVSQNRDRARGEVEANQAQGRLPPGDAGAVSPGKALVPEEVVGARPPRPLRP